jgi:CNT family concentrative nucleoside transporter
MTTLQSILGLLLITAGVWLFGENRRAVRPRLILGGLALQFALAFLFLKFPWAAAAGAFLNAGVAALEEATRAGTAFVFGYVGGAEAPFAPSGAGGGTPFIMAFRALMIIPVTAALSSLLFHWRVLPALIGAFSKLLQWLFGIDGALGFGVAANVFMGMVESPLVIRQYLEKMPRADFFALMTAGMATLAGSMLVLYATILTPVLGNAPLHLLAASIISCPAAVMLARVAIPPDRDAGGAVARFTPRKLYHGPLDAITSGARDGMRVWLDIVFVLVVMAALVALANRLLSTLPPVLDAPLTLQRLLGWLFTPVAWLVGIPAAECPQAGGLLGTRIILNELVAYLDLAALPPETFAPRSRVVLTYALCGFANLGSLGMMLAGLGALVPGRRREILQLGWRSVVVGFLACCMTGAVAGILF